MQPGTLVGGRFEVQGHVHSGGQGHVYRALDRHSGDLVALKLAPASDPDAVDSLAYEASCMRGWYSPRVPRSIAQGVERDGTGYLALAWVEGESLAQRLLRAPLSVPEALALALALCDGLRDIHAAGVLHLDLTPANVLLPEGDPARAKLIDFGMSRRSSDRAGRMTTDALRGTPEYAAPEQLRRALDSAQPAALLDERADLYALGAVAYASLAGKPPFEAEQRVGVLSKVLLETPRPLSQWRTGIPPGLEQLVGSLLEKDRDARKADLKQLRGLFASIDTSGPPTPAPGSAPLGEDEQRPRQDTLVVGTGGGRSACARTQSTWTLAGDRGPPDLRA